MMKQLLLTRRQLLQTGAAWGFMQCIGCRSLSQGGSGKFIQTVCGPISPLQLGKALVHEHIMVDFIGADKTSASRWDRNEVFDSMLPRLSELRNRGITGFVDCTPEYLGRDPMLLRRLAQAADINIVTCTGIYGAAQDKYVPAYAFNESAASLAKRWTNEFRDGIGETGIKPGFIKIGVDPAIDGLVSEIDAKIVHAACLASLATGMTIASHTGHGPAALAQIEILKQHGLERSKFIVVHADAQDEKFDKEIFDTGVWLEFDGIKSHSPPYYAKRIKKVSPDCTRILISMDSGWYNARQPAGGRINDYNYLTDVFVPALQAEKFSDNDIEKLLRNNPADAFSVLKVPRQSR